VDFRNQVANVVQNSYG